MAEPAVAVRAVWGAAPTDVRDRVVRLWRVHARLNDATIRTRLPQICAIAVSGGEVVAVTTAAPTHLDQLPVPLYLLRGFVAPSHRRTGVLRQLVNTSFEALSAWTREHPEDPAQGMLAVLQSDQLRSAAVHRRPVDPDTGLVVIGYSPEGFQLRLRWFDHAVLPPSPEG